MRILQPNEALWLLQNRAMRSNEKVRQLKVKLREALMQARVDASILNDYKREIGKKA